MYCNKNKDYCAHGRKEDGTCYTEEELKEISKTIEKQYGKKLHFIRNNKKELWKDLKAVMKEKYNCDDELCWVETLQLNEIEKEAFVPTMPQEWIDCNKSNVPEKDCMKTWLSNFEIDDVLEQLEENVSNFMYLGSVPIDFAELGSSKKVNQFTIKKALKQKKNKIGIVFNTDPSYRSGQHWICAFIDLENKEINFFDSYGHASSNPPEVDAFLKKVQKDALKHNINMTIKNNTTRHQFKNSECGVYCIKFIMERLNTSFEKLTKKAIKDDTVNKERWERFFRPKDCRPKKV